MAAKKAKHYVNNKEFYEALVAYKKTFDTYKGPDKKPPIPNYVGECIMMVCERLSYRPNFVAYTYRDELIGDAVENCLASIDNFDTDRGKNPFAYFTQIAWNAFIRRIEKENTQTYTRHKNLEHMYVTTDVIYDDHQKSTGQSGNAEGLQRHYDVIKKFEEKLARKKEKAKQSGLEKLLFTRVGRNNI